MMSVVSGVSPLVAINFWWTKTAHLEERLKDKKKEKQEKKKKQKEEIKKKNKESEKVNNESEIDKSDNHGSQLDTIRIINSNTIDNTKESSESDEIEVKSGLMNSVASPASVFLAIKRLKTGYKSLDELGEPQRPTGPLPPLRNESRPAVRKHFSQNDASLRANAELQAAKVSRPKLEKKHQSQLIRVVEADSTASTSEENANLGIYTIPSDSSATNIQTSTLYEEVSETGDVPRPVLASQAGMLPPAL